MYYGNFLATSGSNGDNTFIFFDDNFDSRMVYESQALLNAESYQTIPTYDDSGQVIHPDVVYFDEPWNDYRYWMAMTPYPNSDQKKENPSIVASEDGISWIVPDGLGNPIDNQPGGYNSDTDMIYYQDELIVYYREYSGTPATDKIMRRKSLNGREWTEEEIVLEGAAGGILSPAVLELDGKFFMWYVDSLGGGSSATNTLVKYIFSEDETSGWSEPISVSLSQPGYVVWHIDVKYIPEKQKYYMLYSAFPVGQSNDNDAALFFAQSDDGINWETYNKKAINTHPTPSWDSRAIYRATFLYNDTSDIFRVWYSAKGSDSSWHTGYTERNMATFLDSIDSDNTKKWIDYKKGSQNATIATTSDGIILSGQPNTISSANIRTTKKFTNNIIIELKQRISNERYWDTSIGSYIASEEGFYETRKGEVAIRSREHPTLLSSSPWYHTTLGDGYMWNADDVNNATAKARVYKMVNITANTSALASSSGTPIHPVNQWLKNRYIYSSSGDLLWYVDDNLIVSSNDIAYLDSEKYLLLSQGAYTTSNWGGNREIDYIFVRQYVPVEPEVLFNEEQNLFFTSDPYIELKPSNAIEFVNISDFIEESSKDGGEIKYQISKDSGVNWYWYNGDSWENYNNPDYTKANTVSEIDSNIESFSSGGGNFVFRAFFHSDGTQDIKLESLNLIYSDDVTPPTISGLSNDTTPTQSKTWNWSSDDEDAVYRYVVNQVETHEFTDEIYSTTTSTTQSSGDGTYYLHVQAKDIVDNTSTTTVSAILDNISPVITILGSNPISIYQYDVYTDLGATASDNIDGDITANFEITNNVNINNIGEYSIVYVVSDIAGNTSTSTRAVNVIARPSSGASLPLPSSTGSGENFRIIGMGQESSLGKVDFAGINLLMYINSQVNFQIRTSKSFSIEDHSLKIEFLDINEGKIEIVVASEPQIVELMVGQSLEIDLDNDQINDLQIFFNELVNNRIDLTIKTLDETEIIDEIIDKIDWTVGRWVKTNENSTVYFVDTKNIRHSYINMKIWYSYFDSDFSFVEIISKEELATYTLGKNVPYNAGILFKITSTPKVYLVGENAIIHWIKTEEKARELYGANWNKLVHDLADEFFGNYVKGEAIE